MKLKNLRFILVILTLLPAVFASGQVKFTTVISSQEVGQNDYLQIEYVVENAREINELTPPDFPGFKVAQGPIQSSGMSVVNGNMSQYKGLSFVLQPTRTGKLTIQGAVAVVDGQKMRSNPVTVTVHAGGSGAAPSNSGNSIFPGNPMQPFGPDPFGGPPEPEAVDHDYVLKPGENIKDKIRKNLFVKVQVDRNTCYVGEPIVATYKLYSRLNSESRVTKRPYLNGFSVYDMVDPSTDAVSVEKLNGKAYTVHLIRKTQLIPLQPGNIDLDPVVVENTVHFVKSGGRAEPRHSGNSLRDLLDQLAGENNEGTEVDENVTLDTKPLTITVKPLPEENKPAGYNGAVGSFSIEAALSNKTVAAQDEVTLHVVVKGKGNLPVITAPTVEWPKGIDGFDPTAKEDVNKTVVPMSGSKTFDYVFTAGDSGHYTIPAVNFSYFDPSSQTYKTAGSTPLELQVTASAKKSRSKTTAPAQNAADVSMADRLRHFILDQWGIVWVPLLCLGVVLYGWRRSRRGKDVARYKIESLRAAVAEPAPVAARAAVTGVKVTGASVTGTAVTDLSDPKPTTWISTPPPDPLLEARQVFDNGDYKAFYREVNRAIWKSIGKKLELPASELSKQNVVRQLELRGWDAPSILSLENILNECELNLYTPAYDTYNMQQLLRQAEWMLDRLA